MSLLGVLGRPGAGRPRAGPEVQCSFALTFLKLAQHQPPFSAAARGRSSRERQRFCAVQARLSSLGRSGPGVPDVL